jgi:hypothetical protein
MTSEFELDFEKYGYYFPNSATGLNSHHWYNDKTGLNFRVCARQARAIQDKIHHHPKWKNAGFGINEEVSCGLDIEQLVSLSKEEAYKDLERKSLVELKHLKAIEYKHALFKSVGLPFDPEFIPKAMTPADRWKTLLL